MILINLICIVSCERYAIAIHRFLVNAPKMFGVDFGKRRIVGLGHSLGANTLWVVFPTSSGNVMD